MSKQVHLYILTHYGSWYLVQGEALANAGYSWSGGERGDDGWSSFSSCCVVTENLAGKNGRKVKQLKRSTVILEDGREVTPDLVFPDGYGKYKPGYDHLDYEDALKACWRLVKNTVPLAVDNWIRDFPVLKTFEKNKDEDKT